MIHPGFEVVWVRDMQDEGHGNVNVYIEKGKKMGMRSAAASRGKSEMRNEDAYYTTNSTLGVADGVSAWRSLGIDAGIYARELLNHCAFLDPSLSPVSPSDLPHRSPLLTLPTLLQTAWTRTRSLGSCTVLIAHLSPPNHLSFLSLGDSRGILVRYIDSSPCIVFRTTPQTHDFNVPYQLAHPPASPDPYIEDSVTDAVCFDTETRPGDLIIIGTDGLWDNLFDGEVLEAVRRGGNEREIAEELTQWAGKKAAGVERTPFGVRKGGRKWLGGKPDDVTTVVARII